MVAIANEVGDWQITLCCLNRCEMKSAFGRLGCVVIFQSEIRLADEYDYHPKNQIWSKSDHFDVFRDFAAPVGLIIFRIKATEK